MDGRVSVVLFRAESMVQAILAKTVGIRMRT